MGGSSRAVGWIAGTVVVILGIVAATYFLLYQPRMDDAAETREEAEVVRSQNDILRLQIASLAKEFERLDEHKAVIAALAEEMPPQRDWDTVLEMINGFATESGLPLPALEATTSDATPLTVFATPSNQQAPAEDPTVDGDATDDATDDGSSSDEGEQTAAQPEPEPAGLKAIDGLTMVPFSVRVVGPYANVMQFLDKLQVHDGRLFFVGDLDLTRQKATDATELRPAIADGDLELSVRGYYFSLLPKSGSAPAEEEPTGRPSLPSSGGVNPFVPLEPTR